MTSYKGPLNKGPIFKKTLYKEHFDLDLNIKCNYIHYNNM